MGTAPGNGQLDQLPLGRGIAPLDTIDVVPPDDPSGSTARLVTHFLSEIFDGRETQEPLP